MKLLIYSIIAASLATPVLAESDPCQQNWWSPIDNYHAIDISEVDANLLQSARDGDIIAVLAYLQGGANLEACDDAGFTSLHCAVENDHAELVNILLGIESNVNALNKYGWTPLQEACWRNGNPLIVTALINAGAAVNHRSYDRSSALLEAVQAGHLEAVRLLLAAGANPNVKECYFGRSPYSRAYVGDDALMMELLLSYQANTKTPDELRAYSKIAFYGADPVMLQWTPLHRAAYLNHHGFLVRLIQEQGADVNAQDIEGNTPLHVLLANMNGLHPWIKICIQALRQASADLCIKNNKGQTPLDVLDANRNFDLHPKIKEDVRRLLE